MDYNGTIMDPVMAEMFNNIFNGLIEEYGQVAVLDLYGNPLYLKGFGYVDNMSLKDYAHAKHIGWKKPLSTGLMFDAVKAAGTGSWAFRLNLPEPEEL